MKPGTPLTRFAASVCNLFGDGDRPLPHYRVLEDEFAHLHGELPDGDSFDPGTEPEREHAIRTAIHAQGHTALCFSGGGIRSASFCVGVLQGLARRGLLGTIDYLSTVSGGGYTGGWLSAWLYHERTKPDAAAEVFGALAGNASPSQPEAEPIRRIREYSNYLDPKLGLLSVDVWSVVATVGRNMFLNWLVLLPLLAAALLVPRLYFGVTMLGTQDWIYRPDLLWWSSLLSTTGAVLLATALLYVAVDLPSVGNRQGGQRTFIVFGFGPLALATVAFTWYWAWSRALDADPVTLSGLVTVGAGAHAAIWVVVPLLSRRKLRPLTWLAGAVSGTIGGVGLWWFATRVFAKPLGRGELFTSISVPLILVIICLAGTLFVAIASSETTDDDREWWSRFGAWLLIAQVAWLATSTVVFVGPVLVSYGVHWAGDRLQSQTIARLIAAAVTALTGGIAAKAGRDTRGKNHVPLGRRIVFAIAAPLFVVLLLMLLSAANVWLLGWLDGLNVVPEYDHPGGAGLPEIVLLFTALLALGLGMGLVVAVNKFSLHGMYRSRLIRAFLGASRPMAARHPNGFTGFDPKDNVFLHQLTVTGRPLHVINMALNLVADSRLAWQERKAESFTVSPLAAGNCALGYRPIKEYGGPEGMSLGTAITISGAAASPNMGYHSSPAVTFLLTLFNARLGSWLGNPGEAGRLTWRRSDPVVGAAPLLREMFGRTTDANPYVYLSDGGHFENLGLYEMVSRRCAYIIVCDVACDADYAFEDLGNAIRKIRIDLGIPIEFPDGIHIDAEHEGNGNAHGAVARIRYSAVDGAVKDGVLMYLKATRSGDEPIDVQNYGASHPDFPHETTANQWFGESQFESYRILGLHTVDSVAGEYDGRAGLPGLAAIMTERLGARTADPIPHIQPASAA